MQRALPAADDDAAQAVLIQASPHSRPASPPPIIAQSNFIPVLLWQSAQAEVDPAGERFRAAHRPAMGCTPFQRSLRNSESWVNDARAW